ncbi:MAG: ATP-dependent DNA helicase RecG, partial [Paramuribaculum sp.]|nr:ATP-dependent DNA helicase RecG [Paramuribaculum sp.]
MNPLDSNDIKYLKGVGPSLASLLSKELGITTYADLVAHFPTSYLDRTSVYSIKSFEGEMPSVQVKGHFVSFST